MEEAKQKLLDFKVIHQAKVPQPVQFEGILMHATKTSE